MNNMIYSPISSSTHADKSSCDPNINNGLSNKIFLSLLGPSLVRLWRSTRNRRVVNQCRRNPYCPKNRCRRRMVGRLEQQRRIRTLSGSLRWGKKNNLFTFIVNYAQNALLHHHFYLHKCICIMASLAEHFLQGRT